MRIYRSILYTWINVRVKREVKKGRITMVMLVTLRERGKEIGFDLFSVHSGQCWTMGPKYTSFLDVCLFHKKRYSYFEAQSLNVWVTHTHMSSNARKCSLWMHKLNLKTLSRNYIIIVSKVQSWFNYMMGSLIINLKWHIVFQDWKASYGPSNVVQVKQKEEIIVYLQSRFSTYV